MSNNNKLKNISLILGCILLWFPFILLVILAFFSLVQNGRFLIDFLIPLEIFPVVIVGALLIVVASLLGKKLIKIILWNFIIIVCSLVFAMIYADLSGVASGRTGIVTLSGFLIIFSIIIYYSSTILIGIRGLLLLKSVIKD